MHTHLEPHLDPQRIDTCYAQARTGDVCGRVGGVVGGDVAGRGRVAEKRSVMIQSLQRLAAILALLLSLLAPAHASAMLDPGLGRFNQRDPHPDTYPDGMNAYAGYHVMRGGVDPHGLQEFKFPLYQPFSQSGGPSFGGGITVTVSEKDVCSWTGGSIDFTFRYFYPGTPLPHNTHPSDFGYGTANSKKLDAISINNETTDFSYKIDLPTCENAADQYGQLLFNFVYAPDKDRPVPGQEFDKNPDKTTGVMDSFWIIWSYSCKVSDDCDCMIEKPFDVLVFRAHNGYANLPDNPEFFNRLGVFLFGTHNEFEE